jgi:signal transduction histidine kinase
MWSELPDNLRVMRTAAWIWIVYLASLVIVDMFIYTRGPAIPVLLWYYIANGSPAVIFLALAYSKWPKRFNRLFTPLMILLISATPILLNQLFGFHLPPAPLANLEGMVLRLLPVLFIGLILVAWHYSLVTMILYSVGLNLLELSIVLAYGRLGDPNQMTAFYFIIIIRTVCFIVVGVFINQLITYLRAQQTSLKLANNQLVHYASTLENLTVSRERNRMSRELHDTVVHALSGLSVQLETTRAYLDVDSGTARNLVDQSLVTTRSGLEETRRALKALRASPLEDLGLILAIRKLIEATAERCKLLLDVSLPDKEIFLSPDVEQCIYRITQEALENVVHHAGAQHLSVKLAVSKDEIDLVIRDDGIGFNPEIVPPSGHFGLKGMKERSELVGGALMINSKPSQGTTIRLMIKGSYQ